MGIFRPWKLRRTKCAERTWIFFSSKMRQAKNFETKLIFHSLTLRRKKVRRNGVEIRRYFIFDVSM